MCVISIDVDDDDDVKNDEERTGKYFKMKD